MKKLYKIIALSATIIFSSNILALAETTSSLQNQINQNQNQIESLEDEKEKINSEIDSQNNELQGILNKIDEKSRDLEAAKEEVRNYQEKINEVQAEIDRVNEEIISSQNEISIKEEIIVEKEKEAKKIQENIEKRLVGYYKIDIATNCIYLIIKSENILSLFNNIQSIFRLINFDKVLIAEAKDIQKQLEEEKKEIEEYLEIIEENKKVIVSKHEELKETQKEYIAKQEYHESKMNELYGLESQKSNLIASLSDEQKNLEEKIGDLISYNSELQAQLDSIFAQINSQNNSNTNTETPSTPSTPDVEEESGVVGDPSVETFLRPGSGVVTDSYGPRINPVTGEPGFHTGVDLGDPYGAPVLASKSGTVVYAGWISGYGNTIILDHGGGVQTLYAHNSSLSVSLGQSVYRGQTIALVGSTGMSTGPHIHWEIRINGQHIDPMGYV